ATVRRTPRKASSGDAVRRLRPSRHQVRKAAAAATAPTQPSVSARGKEFQTSAATTRTSTTCNDSASGPPLRSWPSAARRTSASRSGCGSVARAIGATVILLYAIVPGAGATWEAAERRGRAFLRHGAAPVRHVYESGFVSRADRIAASSASVP